MHSARALEVTGNKGVEPAMEWLLAHIGDDITASASAAAGSEGTSPGAETLVLKPTTGEDEEGGEPIAKSFKCNDCQRLFKTQMEIEVCSVIHISRFT